MEWSRRVFPNNRKKIGAIMEKIAEIQDKEVTVQGCNEVEEMMRKLDSIWKREEKYWMQRSRVKWLENGDKNTKFFHQATIQRRRKNKICSLKEEWGIWIEEESLIQGKFLEYYEELFKTRGERNWEEILEVVPRMVKEDFNAVLNKEVEEEEIMKAVFELGALKAPGPDGFNGFFYQKYWEVVKESVVKAVQSFFQNGHMLREINRTNIVLVPKVKKPEEVSQFRPISCCNFVYKVISKVMVSRIKPMMDGLITQNQCAFVERRQIQDNILIANKAFHHMKLKKKGKRYEMVVKVDMNKAYDMVE